jgi:hypothetical protein
MEFVQLQREIEILSPALQKRLMGFLLSIQLKRDHSLDEFERRLDDRSSDSWLSLEEAENRLKDLP